MAKPKKQTKEERLKKKRLAEKKRYERIKNNEELWKEKQEKNRQSYLRRKEQKKELPIAEKTPRQQRLQRKRWRKNYKAYYLRKKQEHRTLAILEQNTPPESPIIPNNDDLGPLQDPLRVDSPSILSASRELNTPSPGPSRLLRSTSLQEPFGAILDMQKSCASPSSSSCVDPGMRRLRYQKDKEVNQLRKIIMNLKKKNECYRKQLERLKEAKQTKLSVSTSTRSVQKTIKRISRKNNKEVKDSIARMPEDVKREIQVFYEDDDNSRLCSGKKEFIVRNKIRKQKRYLNDSLLNLHKKFLKTSSLAISYPAFCKLRPFYVLAPDSKSRETCLCTLHTNVELLVQGLYQRKIICIKTPQNLLSHLCCDPHNVDCLQRACSICKHKVVPYQEFDNSVDVVYWQWVTKQDVITGTNKKIRTTEKQKIRQAPLICIDKLESILSEYFIHCANIAAQQQAFKVLKTDLRDDEVIIHIDFSENYAVKCNQEIQSYHFGGSRKQITLHTAVLYFLNDKQEKRVQSFCTISDCLRHDISAVWAHIIPILEYLSEIKSNIQTLHFIFDSPSSQYRNKKIFHVISFLNIYLNSVKTITWNYSEAGHGKGAPDGVGAVLKRTADRVVSQGKDIKTITDFVEVMNQNIKNIILKRVSEYDVNEKDLLFPQKVKGFTGCMKMHQIIWNENSDVLAVRKQSCTQKECLYKPVMCEHNKHLGYYRVDATQQKEENVMPLSEARNVKVGASFWTGNGQRSTLDEENKSSQKRHDIKKKRISTKVNADSPQIIKGPWNVLRNMRLPHGKNKNTSAKDTREGQSAKNTGNPTENHVIGEDLENLSFSRDFSVDLENIKSYWLDDDDSEDDLNIFT